MVNLPRLVVAAPASGHGKTTVACGLMAALRASGLATSGHKAGPDYIDPGYHAVATGRPGRNLDPVLCGEALVAPLFLHGADGADIAVVEGVMGLFDGRGATGQGSTAHVAMLLGAPVVLVVDCRAQGRSVAALVAGFRDFDPRVRIGGVVLNRVGSARHEEVLRSALAGVGVAVLGSLGRYDEVAVPSRHLGLVPADERRHAATETVGRLGALVREAVDLEAVVALARSAGALTATPWNPSDALRRMPDSGTAPDGPPGGDGALRLTHARRGRPMVAVAGGVAFTFSYTETTELLAAAGAEVVAVDPLRDESLPAGTAGLVLGGGFPEAHAAGLSANSSLRAEVAGLAAVGAPVAAECAGLLYLARELDGQPMCGVIDATARMTGRLTLGYRDATAATDSVLAAAGTAVTGHEFHHTTLDFSGSGHSHGPAVPMTTEGLAAARSKELRGHGTATPAWEVDGYTEGVVSGGVHASYLHVHWAGHPGFAARFVAAARRARAAPAPQVAAQSGSAG